MTTMLLEMLPATHLEDGDFWVPSMCEYCGLDRGSGDSRRTNAHVRAVSDREHLVKGDLTAWLDSNRLNLDRLTGRDPILLTTCFDDRVHFRFSDPTARSTFHV